MKIPIKTGSCVLSYVLCITSAWVVRGACGYASCHVHRAHQSRRKLNPLTFGLNFGILTCGFSTLGFSGCRGGGVQPLASLRSSAALLRSEYLEPAARPYISFGLVYMAYSSRPTSVSRPTRSHAREASDTEATSSSIMSNVIYLLDFQCVACVKRSRGGRSSRSTLIGSQTVKYFPLALHGLMASSKMDHQSKRRSLQAVMPEAAPTQTERPKERPRARRPLHARTTVFNSTRTGHEITLQNTLCST